MKLALIQLWNDKKHGDTSTEGQNSPRGHFLNITTLDPQDLQKIRWRPYAAGKRWKYPSEKLTLQLIKHYEIGDYHLALPMTFHLRLLQRKWLKRYRERIKSKWALDRKWGVGEYLKPPEIAPFPLQIGALEIAPPPTQAQLVVGKSNLRRTTNNDENRQARRRAAAYISAYGLRRLRITGRLI